MSTWQSRHSQLKDLLDLRNEPIAISFTNQLPNSVPHFDKSYPNPTPDGRTGAVSAGCEFWIHSTDKTFYTTEEDHANCSVGSVTHGFKNWEEVIDKQDVGTILACEWVSMDDVPHIQTIKEKFQYVIYGPLKDAPVEPDVVFIRVNGEQLMMLKDAFPDLRIEGKPQCHIIGMARNQDIIAASTGCALSRKRTGMSSNEMSATIPAKSFDEVLEKLSASCKIDDMVAEYAKKDKQRFI